jgi:hypothetical protein
MHARVRRARVVFEHRRRAHRQHARPSIPHLPHASTDQLSRVSAERDVFDRSADLGQPGGATVPAALRRRLERRDLRDDT